MEHDEPPIKLVVKDGRPVSADSPQPPPAAREKKNKGGRPRWNPTNKQRHFVGVALAAGVKINAIAGALGVSPGLLSRRCKSELQMGAEVMNARVAHKLFQKCMKGDTIALLYWTKARMGWSEKQQVEHTGKDIGPIHEQVQAEADAFTQRIASMAERFAKSMASDADETPPANDGGLTQRSIEGAAG